MYGTLLHWSKRVPEAISLRGAFTARPISVYNLHKAYLRYFSLVETWQTIYDRNVLRVIYNE